MSEIYEDGLLVVRKRWKEEVGSVRIGEVGVVSEGVQRTVICQFRYRLLRFLVLLLNGIVASI